MEIHILREGKQIGPFTEEATQALLKEGAVMINDLAWRPGDAQWQPLYAVLYPAASAVAAPLPATPSAQASTAPTKVPPPISLAKAPMPAAPNPMAAAPAPPASTSESGQAAAGEAATARQKAFLSFMGIPIAANLTKAQAALLVNEAMENPKDTRRLQQWNIDRLRLHPDVFADEIKAKKGNRAQHFFEICQSEGAEFFEKVTKAHTQVLVGYLDVRFPNWDENEDDAKYSYFFPAISEKFPQLLKKSARGKFKYPDGPKVAPELTRRSTASAAPKSSPSAAGAMFRGAFMGLIILGILYYGWATFMVPGGKSGTKPASSSGAPTPAVQPVAIKPAPAKDAPKLAAAPTPAKNKPPIEPVKPKAGNPPAVPEKSPVETAETTAPQSESGAGSNSAAVILVSNPFEPLAPTSPIPVPTARATPAPVAATPSGRTTIKLTKPTLVTLKFGTSTLQPGTTLPIVAIEGSVVKARYGPDVVPIPAANTDINDDPAPQ